MKLISSLIASCLAFTYAQNDTTTAEPISTDMSTTMYTSTETIIYQSKVYDPDNDPTDDFEDCEYSWMGTLTSAYIIVEICGFTADEIGYTAIKLDLPTNRWVAFGLSSSGSVDEDDGKTSGFFSNYDGYNIIIPINSEDIQEYFYMADKDRMELEPTMTVISDQLDDKEERRIMRLVREQTIAEVNNTGANLTATEIDDYYFNFKSFIACADAARVSVAYGPKDNERWTKESNPFTQDTYGNREAAEISPEYVDDYDCDEDDDGDDASHIMVFGAFIIGFIAILLF